MRGQHDRKLNGIRAGLLALTVVAAGGCASDHDAGSAARRTSDAAGHGSTIAISPSHACTFQELLVSDSSAATSLASVQGTSTVNASPPTYVWTVNGAEVARGPSLAPHYFQRGDVVGVCLERVGPDGQTEIEGQASTTILNSPPSVQSVILRRDAHDPDRLEAVASTSDADHDVLTLHYEWKLDGVVQDGQDAAAFPLSGVRRGQELACRVTPFDGQASGPALESRPYRLDNQPPQLSVHGKGAPLTDQDAADGRWAGVQIQVTDPDGDAVSVELPGAPADVRWDAARSQLIWKLGDGSGSFEVKVVASDGRGGSVERSLILTR